MVRLILIFTITLLSISSSFSETQDRYRFKTKAQSQQFSRLLTELRCLVCQNQSLADSEASLAEDLRQRIRKHILENQTDQQIKDFFVARYGAFVELKPPVQKNTLILWGAPFLLLILSLGVVLWLR